MDIKVGIQEFYPITYKENGKWTGFEVKLWEEVARRNNFTYVYEEESDIERLLQRTSAGEIEVALAGITRTTQRGESLEMSFHTLATGLLVGVRAHRTMSISDLVSRIFSKPVLRVLWLVVAFALVIAHGYWFIERGESVPLEYFTGVFESIWWAFVTFSTVGYGDIFPATMAGKMFGIVAILGGLAIFGLFIAQLTSSLTEQRMVSRITSIDDLKGKVVGVKAGTTAVQAVRSHGGIVKEFGTARLAAEALVRGTVEAVVADAPILQGMNDLPEMVFVGGLFAHQSYSFVTPHESHLMDRINHSLIAVRGDETYDVLYNQYFT